MLCFVFIVFLLFCVLLVFFMFVRVDDLFYCFGLGKVDIIGEVVEVGMMGYFFFEQKIVGIYMCQWVCVFVIEEVVSGCCLVYVNIDLGMIFQVVYLNVLVWFKVKYFGVYDENNVMFVVIYIYFGLGGFFYYVMYNLLVFGFQEKIFNVIVDGIVCFIEWVQVRLQFGCLFYGSGELCNVSCNCLLLLYLKNLDIVGYEDGIDLQMSVFSFVDVNGELVGVISWFLVYSISMINVNYLIFLDNKGYVFYYWEYDVSCKSGFVVVFVQINVGNLLFNLNLKFGFGFFDNEFDNICEIGLC